MSQLENDYLVLDAEMGQMKLGDLEETDFLEHYGIKGQKWGVRRYQNPDGTLTEEGKKRQRIAEIKQTRKQEARDRYLLSDDELRKKIGRLELEKKLKTLTDEDTNSGERYIKTVGDAVMNRAVTTIAVGATLYGVKALASKHFNANEFANAMFKGGAGKKGA